MLGRVFRHVGAHATVRATVGASVGVGARVCAVQQQGWVRAVSGRPDAAGAGASDAGLRLKFDESAYNVKTTGELLRSIGVFTACQIPWIVNHAGLLVKTADKVLGERATTALIRSTFFAHFCAGEDGHDIQPTLERLKDAGVGAILDYAAENELEEEPDSEVEIRHEARKGVVSARTYDYAGEAECDLNREMFLRAIEDAQIGGGIVAVKLTALGKPALLERFSSLLVAIRDLWYDEFAMVSESDSGVETVTPAQFQDSLANVGVPFTPQQANQLFSEIDMFKDDKLDYLEWTSALRLRDLTEQAAASSGLKGVLTSSSSLKLLDDQETRLMNNLIGRLEDVAAAAAEGKVRLMIDAEQTYLQPAIDHFTLELQRKHNIEFPAIFNTYQCYLKRMPRKVSNDLERSRREGFWFAGKLVRGAYMAHERERALDLGYEDPIHPTIDDTHQAYDGCVTHILNNIERSNLMVASHNESSIRATVAGMADRGIPPDQAVYFGQLLGMADHLTYALGGAGYNAFKYVPYGPIREVLPYLIRRAQENSGMLSNVGKELTMLARALKARTFGGA